MTIKNKILYLNTKKDSKDNLLIAFINRWTLYKISKEDHNIKRIYYNTLKELCQGLLSKGMGLKIVLTITLYFAKLLRGGR